MTLLLIAGQLWRLIPSTGDWYTVAEVAPGLYAYRYSPDPSQSAHGSVGETLACGPGAPSTAREEQGTLESVTGRVGRARA